MSNESSVSEQNEIPNPGSDEAIDNGCKCPVLDNNHGNGWMGTDTFVTRMDCPLHGSGTKWSVDDVARTE